VSTRPIRFAAVGCALAASLSAAVAVAPADTTGVFVIGDVSALTAPTVEFWGAQWSRVNAVSGGSAPASFKGYAVTLDPTGPCTGTFRFTADPGNSSGPPASVGAVIPVLAADLVTKSGPVISGHYSGIVDVATDQGYGPDPGHAGTGTVTGSVCGSSG